ncbi:transposase [Pseudomonadota bacterium]|jgi:putative transposase
MLGPMRASSLSPGRQALRRGRFSQEGGAYLLTTVTHQRIPWFQVFSFAQIMCQTLSRPDCLRDARNLCWVVMPDHIHLLLQLGQFELGTVMKRLKARSAVVLNREIGRRGRFWEPGFHDHALREDEELISVARYIVANPLRAGLVKHVADYPYWNAQWL